MDYFSVFLIAISLSVDCLAVALGAGCSHKIIGKLAIFRVSIAFGIAQFVMPIIGFFAGRTVANLISRFDHWVAFGILMIVAIRMLWEFFSNEKEKERDISKGLILVTLALATSIDALAVGLSFAFLNVQIFLTATIIGIVAAGVTVFGFWLGGRVNIWLGRWAKLFGALVLISIGVRILVSHLFQ
jgi:manganese efflux pump family protein